MKNKKHFILLLLTVSLFSAACQDHHYKSYDEMGPLPEPDAAANDERVLQKMGKTGGPQAPGPASSPQSGFTGVIAAGKVELSSEIGQPPEGWTLYIIVRPEKGGPALAAGRLDNVTFPARFKLNEKNIMMGEPEPGMNILVEAVYDSDGDPITKEDQDLFGQAEGVVSVGATDIVVTLSKRAKEGA